MKPLIAVLAVVAVAAAAAIGVITVRRANAGPDPWAGRYPLVTPKPTGTPDVPTWTPKNPPKGPLPRFKGKAPKVTGRTTDRQAGLSYARFGAPWHGFSSIVKTGGQQFDSRAKSLEKFWYVSVYSQLLRPELQTAAGAAGPQAMRAAAELAGRKDAIIGDGTGVSISELAGAPMRIDGHQAWVTAFRLTPTDGAKRPYKHQTWVVVAVNTGRGRFGIVEMTVPSNKERLLPFVNTVIDSIHVI